MKSCTIVQYVKLLTFSFLISFPNCRYYSQPNPHWMEADNQQSRGKVMVWCGIWHNQVIRPFYFEGHAWQDDASCAFIWKGKSCLVTAGRGSAPLCITGS
uniref:Uncharacterized protein n=1 Tax=Octopus bimaculoides TaxID=37653 RepID=A0A0L8HUW0_OCTBM